MTHGGGGRGREEKGWVSRSQSPPGILCRYSNRVSLAVLPHPGPTPNSGQPETGTRILPQNSSVAVTTAGSFARCWGCPGPCPGPAWSGWVTPGCASSAELLYAAGVLAAPCDVQLPLQPCTLQVPGPLITMLFRVAPPRPRCPITPTDPAVIGHCAAIDNRAGLLPWGHGPRSAFSRLS